MITNNYLMNCYKHLFITKEVVNFFMDSNLFPINNFQCFTNFSIGDPNPNTKKKRKELITKLDVKER